MPGSRRPECRNRIRSAWGQPAAYAPTALTSMLVGWIVATLLGLAVSFAGDRARILIILRIASAGFLTLVAGVQMAQNHASVADQISWVIDIIRTADRLPEPRTRGLSPHLILAVLRARVIIPGRMRASSRPRRAGGAH